MNTQYRAVIDGSGGDATIIEAEDMADAKRQAREWAQAGTWGPEEDTIKVWVAPVGEMAGDHIEVTVGGA